METLAIV